MLLNCIQENETRLGSSYQFQDLVILISNLIGTKQKCRPTNVKVCIQTIKQTLMGWSLDETVYNETIFLFQLLKRPNLMWMFQHNHSISLKSILQKECKDLLILSHNWLEKIKAFKQYKLKVLHLTQPLIHNLLVSTKKGLQL